MANIQVVAGDFPKGQCLYFLGVFSFGTLDVKAVADTELKDVEIATEESVKRMGGTVGWGIVGAALLGPVGLLAGLLLGGKSKEVTFIATFRDGKKMLGTTNSETFVKLKARALDNQQIYYNAQLAYDREIYYEEFRNDTHIISFKKEADFVFEELKDMLISQYMEYEFFNIRINDKFRYLAKKEEGEGYLQIDEKSDKVIVSVFKAKKPNIIIKQTIVEEVTTNTNTIENLDKLLELSRMKKEGLITDEEFFIYKKSLT